MSASTLIEASHNQAHRHKRTSQSNKQCQGHAEIKSITRMHIGISSRNVLANTGVIRQDAQMHCGSDIRLDPCRG